MSISTSNLPGPTTPTQKEPVRLPVPESKMTFDSLPLSCSQQRLWFVDQFGPRQSLYNVPSALRLEGPLDVRALQKSLGAIVERHEILRTTYGFQNGHPVQEIEPAATVPLSLVDLRHLANGEREKTLQATLEAEAARPFDLGNDDMLRARVFQLGLEDHVLFTNFHHIACDEWSLDIFFRELAHFYKGASTGGQVALAELPIQYADFALWQREWLQSGVWLESLAYWKKQLTQSPPLLELPADHPRPPASSFRGARSTRSLPPELVQAVQKIAREQGTTSYVVFLTVFKTLLSRYASQTDIQIGTAISGRDRPETADLIGFFVNLLALRTDLPGDLTFLQALSRVRETVLRAFAHQEIPFEKLVAEIKPERIPGQNPLFNVVFAFHKHPDVFSIPGLRVTPIEVYNHTAKFDLNLTVIESATGATAVCEYSTDLFDEPRVQRLLQNLESLIANVVAHPTLPIGQQPLLAPGERTKILVEWNRTRTDFPRNVSVHQLFEQQAARSGDRTALVFDGQSISYADLNARANQLAHFLRRRGVTADTPVGICVERSANMIIGILAILKAGGAYLPLDTSYPAGRLAFMARDAGVSLLLTQKKMAMPFAFEGETVCLDQDDRVFADEPRTNPPNQTRPENLAYIIYTSGSTGIPKGICIPHRAINRLVCNSNYVQFGSDERIAQISNASFDAATFEIWGALLFGGLLIGFSRETVLSPARLAAEIQEKKITSLFLTVALFNQMAADFPHAFGTVKNLLVGGDALDPAAVRRVLHAGAPRRFLNGYGPTECTTFALWHQIEKVDDAAASIPIGRPLSNTEAYILDTNLQPLPVGIPGELYLGGDGLARGYLHRPELNREKFIDHPFSPEPGARLYKSGDLARYRADGVVEFLGRIDHQVKLRGFRIELGEIEATLAQHPDVRETVVVVAQETPGEKRLVAYLSPRPGRQLNESALRELLGAKLPDYMIPSLFMFLDQLPLTPNGKVDRRALPAPRRTRDIDTSRGLARNNIELELVKIWERVLQVQPVGIDENFFDLGGHSLLAVRLFAEIERAFGCNLPLSILFQAPTIEQLARALAGKGHSPDGSCVVTIQAGGNQTPIFWLHTLGGGGGGGLFTYRKLAECLGPDQPCYGIVSPSPPHSSLEEMAAHYIKEMRVYQPHSPYRLGGYCFGGVIAYEMARQLTEQGEEVGFLGLIDSAPPNVRTDLNFFKPSHLASLTRHAYFWMEGFFHSPRGGWIAHLRKRIGKWMDRIFRPEKRCELAAVIDMSQYPPDFRHNAEEHWRALRNYQPRPYEGKIVLFRARQRALSEGSPTLNWGSVVPEKILTIPITGNHESILDSPHVDLLARRLKECLDSGPTKIIRRQQPLGELGDPHLSIDLVHGSKRPSPGS